MTDISYWKDHWWPAPAKLNLLLKITGRREDGYHTLQTVFQLLAFYDWLNFVPREDGALKLVRPLDGVSDTNHLLLRAARLLQADSGCQQGADMDLRKVLPMGAGMGGGSSDAATALVVLNQVWELGYSLQQLAELGLQLGADVPVFVHGHSAWAEGVGEQLTALDIEESWYLVVTPGTAVSTADVFAHEGLTRDSAPITIRAFQNGLRENDCFPVVRGMYDELDAVYGRFSEHAEVHLTGTGSSMFACCPSRQAAMALSEQLPDSWTKWIVKGVNQSQLHGVLKERPCPA